MVSTCVLGAYGKGLVIGGCFIVEVVLIADVLAVASSSCLTDVVPMSGENIVISVEPRVC